MGNHLTLRSIDANLPLIRHMNQGGAMKAIAAIFTMVCLVAGMTTPACAQHDSGARVRIVIAAEPDAESLAKAREIIKLMYHDGDAGDMEDWLFEKLMDRYRRAFDLADLGDSDIKAAVHDELSAVQPRLRPIVARHIDEIRDGMAAELASRFDGEQLNDLVAFARTPGGRNYLETYPVLVSGRPFFRGLLADNVQLARQINAELQQRAPHYLGAHPALEAAVYAAAIDVQ
jgi:hypothetical protein